MRHDSGLVTDASLPAVRARFQRGPPGAILGGMLVLGATLVATVAAWLVDAVVALVAPMPVRVLVGFVVSTVAFYWGLKFLRELRGS